MNADAYAPAGVAIDAQTGRLTWTPTVEQVSAAAYAFAVCVTDGDGQTTTLPVNVTVGEPLPPQPAPVELLVNGSFEEYTVTQTGKWDVFSAIPGWSVADWTTGQPQLELHRPGSEPSGAFIAPANGAQYAELDGDINGHVGADPSSEQGSVTIWQSVATAAGARYTLSFSLAARPDTGSADNVLEVHVRDALTGAELLTAAAAPDFPSDHQFVAYSPDWSRYSFSFIAAGPEIIVSFADAGTNNTRGTYLDDVSLTGGFFLDLDVNANGLLTDAVDGALRYLPGQVGDECVIAQNGRYVGQQMRIVADGIGYNDGVDEVQFEIVETTQYAGWTGNASDVRVEGPCRDDDVSFQAMRNLRIAAGRVEADKCWIPIWCKDTGAAARVRATFLRGGVPLFVAMLDVPADGDTDQLPTNWEHAMVQEWNAQYQENNEVSEAFFGPTDDKEQRAPGPNETQQKTVGDRLTVLQEYRGFLLDGGGFGRDGTGGFTGQQKHVRLSPARKEALLEVDQTEKLDAPRQGEVAVYLDGAAKIWSKDAGVYVYYMLDESPMDTPPFKKTDTLGQVRDNERRYLKDHRGNPKNQPAVNAAIAQCFTHFILLSTAFDNYTRNEGAHTYSEATPGTAADQMGVYVYTAMLAHGANILTGTNDGTSVTAASYGASVIAHELMHMVIAPTRGSQGWDTAEHLVSDPTQSELMFRDRAAFKRFQFSTVAIGDKTLREIDLKGNPCLHP